MGSNHIQRTYWLSLVCLLAISATAWGQKESKSTSIWEYTPYKAQVWISFDPRLPITESTMDHFVADLAKEIDRSFGATFETSISATPRFLDQLIYQEYETFNIDRLLESELVLAISKEIPGSNTIRSLESSLERIETFSLDETRGSEILKELESLKENETFGKVAAKLQIKYPNPDAVIKALISGETQAGIISKYEFNKLGDRFRSIPLRFPWQVESMLRRQDKIYFVRVTRDTEVIRTQVRELDCAVSELGAIYQGESTAWQQLSRVGGDTLMRAFVPMARIDDIDDKNVTMRIRAGGLISFEGHPATIYPGDVLRPMMPNANRSALGQSIPWTYVAVTYGDNVLMGGTVFSAMKSPLGNQKKKMNRTALRVQTPYTQTTLQLMMKPLHVGKGPAPAAIPAEGMSLYERVPSKTNLDLQGRTDWRGKFTLTRSDLPEIDYDLPKPKSSTEEAAPVAAEVTAIDPNAAPLAPGEEPEKPKGKVRLRVPLYLYYIKNGDVVLARLPIVIGMNETEIGDLPDDTRRLEAEAFVNGLKFQIIDNVARRKMLASRINMRINENQEQKARELLDQLKATKSYDQLNLTLDTLQRRVNSPDRGPIPLVTQRRIDGLFDSTRTLMQKYMQDSLVQEMTALVDAKFQKIEYEEEPKAEEDGSASGAPAQPATNGGS